MKLATIQNCPEFKKPKENLGRLVHLIKQAKDNGAKLVVLSELCHLGYSWMSKKEALPFAEQVMGSDRSFKKDKSLSVIPLLAKQWNIHIVWGFMELDPLTGKLYNSQALVTPSGKIFTYRKINRFGNDFIWAAAGNGSPPVIPVEIDGRILKVGLLICRDVRDKKDDSDMSFYQPGDADLVAISCAWGKGGFPATAWMDFVRDNKTTLIVANRYGVEQNNDFGLGGICVISPSGDVQCEGLEWGKDCIVYYEV